jgi:hypothetical protein
MPFDRDHYEVYYADKLWNLLPAIYRAQDSDDFGANGPLREMVNRIGAQVAILRRSIDRLWEDQSIETCDDWVVAYIGDLLATNLVASLDARGQRLDVAKTIYYRRRKGTVAILEEIAADITGWDARVVEFFRRLSRTRHGLDPEIGFPSQSDDSAGKTLLQLAEGLVGPMTHTPMGGWADLRNAYGAIKTQTAFDEFFHTADFRNGRGRVGWHSIPHLGVFLWRLRSFGVSPTSPVPVQNCPNYYSFDPTGREIPLFASPSRAFGDAWNSPQEWQLPTPISTPLLQSALNDPAHESLYAALAPDGITLLPNSLGAFRRPGVFYDLVPASDFFDPATHRATIFPEVGKLKVLNAPANDQVYVTYHYGFTSTLGAGPFDRRVLGQPPEPEPPPVTSMTGGAAALAAPLGAVAPTGSVMISDSLTYTSVADVTGINQVHLLARNKERPLIRLAPPSPNVTEWSFTGQDGSTLVLEGLFVSGGDLVLKGVFDRVALTCCTLDPGSAGDPPVVFQQSVDGRDLRPCRLWVEAQVRTLTVDRCIIGPIRTRAGGEIETLSGKDSIMQGIRTSGFALLVSGDIKDPIRLVRRLRDAFDPLSQFLQTSLSAGTKPLLSAYDGTSALSPALAQGLLQDLNAILGGASIYNSNRFDGVPLAPSLVELANSAPTGADLLRLNRLLLEAAYPVELADLALGLTSGQTRLSRTTVLGPAALHRLYASECILDDVIFVENDQDGCVRFTAWSTGSVLPRKYESVEIAPNSPLFTSRNFGQPGYSQLQPNVDLAMVTGAEGATISAGAEDGSEMGAFAREKNPVKERSLLIKYREYMPLGLTPVLVYVT